LIGIGGEAVSLAIPWSQQEQFNDAGYTGIRTNNSYIGGQVRQHGNLSFSRVYQAGHEAPTYQPETAYRIFMRALFNQDIANGEINTLDNPDYSTRGPADTWAIKNEPPEQYLQFCYVLDPTALCTEDQIMAIENGTAQIVNYIVVDSNSTELFPAVAEAASSTDEEGSSESETGSATATGGAESTADSTSESSGESSGAEADGAGSLKFEVLPGPLAVVVLAMGLGAAMIML
jgi:hypothetical protein